MPRAEKHMRWLLVAAIMLASPIVQAQPATLTLACKGTTTQQGEDNSEVSIGIIVNFTARTVNLRTLFSPQGYVDYSFPVMIEEENRPDNFVRRFAKISRWWRRQRSWRHRSSDRRRLGRKLDFECAAAGQENHYHLHAQVQTSTAPVLRSANELAHPSDCQARGTSAIIAALLAVMILLPVAPTTPRISIGTSELTIGRQA